MPMHVTAALLCLAAQAEADPEEELLAFEEELVETASRATDPLRLAPASITLISPAEKDDFAYVTLLDAGTGVRGFYPTDDKTYPTLGVRGISSLGLYGNRLQVQLDGHVLNEDWAGGSNTAFDLLPDLTAIDRIELVRGPGSALFGTGAMLGVINLVSAKAAPARPLRVGVGASSEGFARLHAMTGLQLESGPGMWLYVGAMGRAGHDVELPGYRGTAWAPDGVAHGAGAEDSFAVYGRAWFGDASLALFTQRRDNQLGAFNYGVTFGDLRNREDISRSFVELRYEPTLTEGLQLLTRAYVDGSAARGNYTYTDLEYTKGLETFSSEWGGAEARVLWTSIPTLRVAAGLEGQSHPTNTQWGQAEPEPEPYIDEVHAFHTGSVYTNVDWDPASWLRLSAGVRLDGWFFEELGTPDDPTGSRMLGSIDPRLAVIFLPSDDDTIKLIAGRAFRVPSILELTYNDGDYTATRNPELVPESAHTAELEYLRSLPAGFRLTAATHFTAIYEVIGQEGSGEPDDLLRYDNGEDPLLVYGAELELSRAIGADWSGSVWASYARANRADLISGPRLENSPRYLGALKATYAGLGPAAHLSTRVTAEAGRVDRDGEETPGALLWDLFLTGRVVPLSFDYALSVKNVLDSRVVHPVSADIAEATLVQPGRTVFAEVRFSL